MASALVVAIAGGACTPSMSKSERDQEMQGWLFAGMLIVGIPLSPILVPALLVHDAVTDREKRRHGTRLDPTYAKRLEELGAREPRAAADEVLASVGPVFLWKAHGGGGVANAWFDGLAAPVRFDCPRNAELVAGDRLASALQQLANRDPQHDERDGVSTELLMRFDDEARAWRAAFNRRMVERSAPSGQKAASGPGIDGAECALPEVDVAVSGAVPGAGIPARER